MGRRILAALSLSVAVLAATAAAAPPRTRGTVEGVSGDTLTLDTRGGQKIEMKLTPETRVLSAARAQLGDIQPDSFVGVTAAPQPDGTLRAMEVHVFAPSLRGMGEGHYAWDLTPSSTMTNGAVGAIKGTQGRTMTVTYKGGDKRIEVPEDTPIVAMAPADRSAIRPGAKAVALGNKGADGTLAAVAVIVGADGVTPPM